MYMYIHVHNHSKTTIPNIITIYMYMYVYTIVMMLHCTMHRWYIQFIHLDIHVPPWWYIQLANGQWLE